MSIISLFQKQNKQKTTYKLFPVVTVSDDVNWASGGLEQVLLLVGNLYELGADWILSLRVLWVYGYGRDFFSFLFTSIDLFENKEFVNS